MIPIEFQPIVAITRVLTLVVSEEIMNLALLVLTQYQSVTDRRTVRQTDKQRDEPTSLL